MTKRLFIIFLLTCFICPQALAQRPQNNSFDEQETLSDIYRSFRGGVKSKKTPTTSFKETMSPQVVLKTVSYQIHVLGEVENPGTYKIPASERALSAINVAGGVLNRGSERKIELRRNGKVHKRIDLFKYKSLGQLQNNPYLLDNDIIYVPLKKESIRIAGAVGRPDLYELNGETNLLSLINLAGGFSVGLSNSKPIKIIRHTHGVREVVEVPTQLDSMKSVELQNGDVVTVPQGLLDKHEFDLRLDSLPGDPIFFPSYEDRVFVLGGVFQPGPYNFNQNYNLKQYLSLAGGTTRLAKNKVLIVPPKGKSRRANSSSIINPGDTIIVKERRIPPEGWLGITASIVGITSAVINIILITK